MNDDDALSELARALLAEEARRPKPPARQIDALWTRIEQSVGGGPSGGGGGSGSGSGSGSGGAGAETASHARGSTIPPSPAARAHAPQSLAQLAPWVGAAFVIGGAVGALSHALATRAPERVMDPAVERVVERVVERIVYVERSHEDAVASNADEASFEGPGAERPDATRSGAWTKRAAGPSPAAPNLADPRDAAAPVATSPSDAELAEERAYVDRARMALARGATSDVLEATDSHQRAFPDGRLREEREALAIRALVQRGDVRDATDRLRRFRERYPKSLFLPSLAAALRDRDATGN
jgi:hypothetical protein